MKYAVATSLTKVVTTARRVSSLANRSAFAAAVAFRRRPQISSSKVSRFRSTLPKVRFRDRGSGISNAPLLERPAVVMSALPTMVGN